jgi:hypothetical protein
MNPYIYQQSFDQISQLSDKVWVYNFLLWNQQQVGCFTIKKSPIFTISLELRHFFLWHVFLWIHNMSNLYETLFSSFFFFFNLNNILIKNARWRRKSQD